ncbi:galactan 5-O-arabinofuranosyltransferase [Nocardia sp. NPDC051463]|uniref:galactan 5-O-arabinofuranosyltransferase n=1 Tax=Nocardia sp. NPDC051463 TaxID=3154845 RepID=UPI0034503364
MTTATAVHPTVTRPTRGALIARHIGSGLGAAISAALVAVIVATVGLVAFSMVQWPAFNSSNVTRAMTTVGQVLAAVLLAVAIGLIRVQRWPLVAELLSWVGISTFVTFTLGMPLAATKLYLFGVSVDQEFRTEYLTRLTDSAALHDMTYADLPPFYPAGWFWIGGRVANVLGMDGWEAFKPYAIGSLAVAAAISLVLWSKLIRADWAIGVTAAITAVALTTAAPEAYSAVIVILLPPALVLAWGALHRPGEHGGNKSAARPATPIAGGDTTSGAASAEPDSSTTGASAPESIADPAEHGSRTTGTDARAGAVVAAERGSRTAGGWGAVIGTGLFLGIAAMFYTLYFGLAAFAIGLMGLTAAGLAVRAQRAAAHPRRARVVATTDGGAPWRAAIAPLVRLAVIAVIAGVVALVVWLPYLLKWLGTTTPKSGTALHYLPVSGSELPLPMAQFSLLGGLCLIGTAWLVVRASSSRRAQALGIGVVAIYLWTLLSMAATAAGTTLLSFRLEPILDVLLAAAGAFGFVEGARAAYQAFNEPGRFRLAVIALATVGALAFTQDIPRVLAPEITTAYTDTDGNGERADQRSPSAVSHYREVDAALLAQTGRPRSETVLLTADTSFLAFYPYYGFQALTSHYANPLADFAGRAATIKGWSKLDSSRAMLDALAASPWRAPDAFLFRSNGDNYTLRLAEDVYPNDPNVKRYTVTFPKKLFNDPHFTSTDIGPFTLITVTR